MCRLQRCEEGLPFSCGHDPIQDAPALLHMFFLVKEHSFQSIRPPVQPWQRCLTRQVVLFLPCQHLCVCEGSWHIFTEATNCFQLPWYRFCEKLADQFCKYQFCEDIVMSTLDCDVRFMPVSIRNGREYRLQRQTSSISMPNVSGKASLTDLWGIQLIHVGLNFANQEIDDLRHGFKH